jgi:hypothetical protein
MFCIEKVSKMGLFWLSLFLCYLSLVNSGCQLMGKYILLVMGCGSMVVIANVGVFCLFEYWHYCSGAVVMRIN